MRKNDIHPIVFSQQYPYFHSTVCFTPNSLQLRDLIPASRKVKARVEGLNGTTVTHHYACADVLQDCSLQ
jgi:hypothetical protein